MCSLSIDFGWCMYVSQLALKSVDNSRLTLIVLYLKWSIQRHFILAGYLELIKLYLIFVCILRFLASNKLFILFFPVLLVQVKILFLIIVNGTSLLLLRLITSSIKIMILLFSNVQNWSHIKYPIGKKKTILFMH